MATITKPDSVVPAGAFRSSSEPAAVPLDAHYEAVLRTIRDLSALEKGWDSYRGAPVTEEARRRALAFVTTLLTHLDDPVPAPTVGPSPDGGVVFRWVSDEHEVMIVFLSDGGEYSVARPGSDEVLEEGRVGRLESLVQNVISRYVR